MTRLLRLAPLFGLALGLGACAPAGKPASLELLGNMCTLLTAPDGTRILSDPYGFAFPSGLSPLPKGRGLEADVVTVSHDHPDHNAVNKVRGRPPFRRLRAISGPGSYRAGMVKITAIEEREGAPTGQGELPNRIFIFEFEGLKIVHLGDSGWRLKPETLAAIENADLVIVNIDGYVIPPAEILPFLRRIKARGIVPAHYSLDLDARWQDAPTIGEFIASLPPELPVSWPGAAVEPRAGQRESVIALDSSLEEETMKAAKPLRAKRLEAKLLDGPDGLALGKDGSLYAANWGRAGGGSTVVRIAPDGTESVAVAGLAAPDGLAFDAAGRLHVSSYASGEVLRVEADGQTRVLARGLHHPSALAFDKEGSLFVAELGDYDGTRVLRIDERGRLSVFAEGLDSPLGLAFDAAGRLYVSSYRRGLVWRLDEEGRASEFARLAPEPGGAFQYLAFDAKGDLYCPSFGLSKIFRVTPEGRVASLNLVDEAGEPLPSGPNSVLVAGKKLYFTEFSRGRLYEVLLE